MSRPPAVLFSQAEIAARVTAIARAIAEAPHKPQIMTPVLTGAFVFAADLARALCAEALDLEIEFLRLRSYGAARQGGEMAVLTGPGDAVRGKHVLLVDGVLDRGHTLRTARDLLVAAGASAITTAVAVDKAHPDVSIKADHACFTGVRDFLVGYGMDDAGMRRGLPYIGKA